MPPFLPAGEWKVEIEFLTMNDSKKRESIELIQLWMIIKERGTTKLLMG